MTVRPLDLATATTDMLDGVYEVSRLCQAEESPAEPPRTRAEMEGFLLHVPASDLREYWVAEDGGAIVGFGQLAGARKSPAPRVEVLVHPDARRRGHGLALLESVLRAARERGARELIGVHATEAGSRFAARAGAADSQRDVRSLLRLPVEASTAPVEGYALESWVGAAPERLLDSFARAREAINDAPFPSDAELEEWDGARVRALETALERRNRDIRVTVANTEDTAVVAAHRRRGLGRWVKVESLRRLQADRPDVELVTTVNAEENEAILRLNRSLGFAPVSIQTSCVLQLQG